MSKRKRRVSRPTAPNSAPAAAPPSEEPKASTTAVDSKTVTKADGKILNVTSKPVTSQPPTTPVRLENLFPDYSGESFTRRAIQIRKQLIVELRKAYLSEGLILYLGAGVSMSIGLPSWNDLIHSLTVAMMSRRVNSAAKALGDLQDEERANALKTLLDVVEQQRISQKPILMMARAIKDEFGKELASQVALHLYGRLKLGGGLFKRLFAFLAHGVSARAAQGEIDLPTSPLLDAIVALVRSQRGVEGVQAIVNYNYDDIVEERLRRESVHCLTVLSGKIKLTLGRLPCYHVHGVLPVREYFSHAGQAEDIETGNFVFSEDEYHTEYGDPYRWSNLTQIGLLSRQKGLFIGLSMQDPNLRRLIEVTHWQYPEIWKYAILPRAPVPPNEDTKGTILRNLAEEVEAESFKKIGVKVIWVDDVTKDVAPVLREIVELPDE